MNDPAGAARDAAPAGLIPGDPTMSALQGIRVVEIGRDVSAPFCARLFADLGAEVVKIEPPDGDSARGFEPLTASGESAVFHYLNAGKQGAVADLDDAAGLAFLHEQLAGSDVLVENTEHDAYAKWGLSAEALRARHPHLVVVSISPYGRTGPWAERPGSDLTAQAASALPLALGRGDREPLRIPFDQADYQAALHAFAAALCALRERRSSGQGQGIDVSVAQVMAYQVGGMHLVTAKNGAKWERRQAPMKGTTFPIGFFPCKDGFVAVPSQTPKQWKEFIALMDDPRWAKKDELVAAIGAERVEQEETESYYREWLMETTRAELLEMAAEKAIVMGVAQTVDDVLSSDHLAFRELFEELAVDADTRVKVPKPGYRMAKSPTALSAPAPSRDQHGDALRASPPEARQLTKGEHLSRSLEGVRVLDFGWNWAGPMAGQLLADMGAEVIRVETSKRQDMMRFLKWTSWFFCHNNRSKMSATFNLAKPEAAGLVRKLARKADIVIDNFAAGVMAKNGLGYEDLVKENPDIIAVSMSMAGQEGPLRRMRGFASIATAFSSLELMVGHPEDDTSTGLIPFGLGDTSMAIQGVIGALAALHHRDRTGEGQFVDVSQIDCSTATMGEPLLDHQLRGAIAKQQANLHSQHAPHGLYPAAGEDRWVSLAVRDEAEWKALCATIGRDDLAGDAGLEDAAGRRARADEIDAAIRAWTEGRDNEAGAAALAAAGVPAAPLLEFEERDGHEEFAARRLLLEHDYEGFDPCQIYATPWQLDATPAALTRPCPGLGEQNDYVFKELLELGDDEIAALQEGKVLV